MPRYRLNYDIEIHADNLSHAEALAGNAAFIDTGRSYVKKVLSESVEELGPESGDRHEAYFDLCDYPDSMDVTHKGHTFIPGDYVGTHAGKLAGCRGVILCVCRTKGAAFSTYWYDPLLRIDGQHFVYDPGSAANPGEEGGYWHDSVWKTVARVPFEYEAIPGGS